MPPKNSWAQDSSQQRRQCWSPSALRGSPDEKEIVRNVAKAYKRIPGGSAFVSPLPDNWRGVIRRVDLPAGVMKIALTFDLCEQPHEIAGYDSAIVDYLRDTKTKATFFAGGKWMANHEVRAREIIADPLFEVGNHTWEHRNLRAVRGQLLWNEIIGAQLAYIEIHRGLVRDQCIADNRVRMVGSLVMQGGQPSLFRFPFGACDPQSLHAVGDAGLVAIQWDISSGDSMLGLTAQSMAQAVVNGARSGSIVLFHANGRGWQTAQALRLIVPALRQKYELVTVSELLNTEGARPVIRDTCYDSRPGDTNQYDSLARALKERYDAFRLRHGPRAAGSVDAEPQVLKVPRPKHERDGQDQNQRAID
jgi:peptidoglycan/xylan/chitin deacetylase (PgdA/CDA1 family)